MQRRTETVNGVVKKSFKILNSGRIWVIFFLKRISFQRPFRIYQEHPLATNSFWVTSEKRPLARPNLIQTEAINDFFYIK